MEINVEEFVKQLYQERIRFLISGLVAIEQQLDTLKLEKFSYPIRAIVLALSIEELNMSKVVLKTTDHNTRRLAKDLIKTTTKKSRRKK